MHPRHNRRWWRDAVARWQQSGLTAGQFARDNDVCPDNFRWWRRELARERAAVPVAQDLQLVRVEVSGLAPTGGCVQAAAAAAALPPDTVLALVGPAELRIAVGTDVAYVGALIAAIGQAVRPC